MNDEQRRRAREKQAAKRKRKEKYAAEKEIARANMTPVLRRRMSTQSFSAHLRANMCHIGKTEIVPDQLLNDPVLQKIVSESLANYSSTMFNLFRIVELGDDYAPMKAKIRELFDNLTRELGAHNLAVQLIRYHIAAERQSVIHDGAEDDTLVKKALEALNDYSCAPLMAEMDVDAAYTLWSRTGSWVGAMELAGLELPITKAERRKKIARYRAMHASPELLPETIRLNLTPAAIHTLTMICNMANKAGRLLYDFELPSDAVETFRLCGHTLWELPRLVGLTAPTDKASPEIKAAAKARKK